MRENFLLRSKSFLKNKEPLDSGLQNYSPKVWRQPLEHSK
jgi:hypothetical protein